MTLVADTSGLLASIDRNEPAHAGVAEVLRAEKGDVLVSDLVIAELDYLILRHLGRVAEEAFLEDLLAGVYRREPLTDADMARGLALVRRYRDHDIGITDATLLAVAERHDCDRILTLDHQHFRTLRFRDRSRLTLLPADARSKKVPRA